MLTKALNLRFYYIPLAQVGTPPETPVRWVAHIIKYTSRNVYQHMSFPPVPSLSGCQYIFSLLLPRTSGSVVRQQHQWSTDINHEAVWNGKRVILLCAKCLKFQKKNQGMIHLHWYAQCMIDPWWGPSGPNPSLHILSRTRWWKIKYWTTVTSSFKMKVISH